MHVRGVISSDPITSGTPYHVHMTPRSTLPVRSIHSSESSTLLAPLAHSEKEPIDNTTVSSLVSLSVSSACASFSTGVNSHTSDTTGVNSHISDTTGVNSHISDTPYTGTTSHCSSPRLHIGPDSYTSALCPTRFSTGATPHTGAVSHTSAPIHTGVFSHITTLNAPSSHTHSTGAMLRVAFSNVNVSQQSTGGTTVGTNTPVHSYTRRVTSINVAGSTHSTSTAFNTGTTLHRSTLNHHTNSFAPGASLHSGSIEHSLR